jgi:hypothetical protein
VTSFISNSKSKPFFRLLLSVGAILVLLDIFTVTVLFRIAGDFSRFSTYGSRAAALARQSGMRFALIGNSTAEEGVSGPLLAETLQQQGIAPLHLDLFLADGSQINTWYFMMNHYFWKENRKLDAWIVMFYGNDLRDPARFEVGRIAQFFTDWRDLPEILNADLLRPADRWPFLLSSFWGTYAARDRLKERTLRLFLPDYEAWVIRLNQTELARDRQRAGASPPPPNTYRALLHFLKTAEARDTPLIFIAYPVRSENGHATYAIDPAVVEMLHAHGATYIDLRQVAGLERGHYADHMHMNETGRRLYTQRLAEVLPPVLTSIGQARPHPPPAF